ncbi:MAG: hypothetical protein HY817_03450 [Candidatus Abawacabacteria bacterium]|nr:hypothetical protein [Candidatus Abawacabacteria bacterium]
MADIENPIGLEKGHDVQGQKPSEAGAIPPGVMEKASEYGVQPSQWQQYGQHIQDEYNRIMNVIMHEYKLLDEVEQTRILKALESGDDHALDDVLLLVEAHLQGQNRELPHVLGNLKKVAAKKIIDLAAEGKLETAIPTKQAQYQDDALAPVVEIIVTFFQTANVAEQQAIKLALVAGTPQALDALVQKLTAFGYKLEELNIDELKRRAAEKILR